MIKPVDISIINGRGYKYGKVQADIMQFVNSDWPACEVDIDGYTNNKTAYAGYRACIKKLHVGVAAITRGNSLFLIKTDM